MHTATAIFIPTYQRAHRIAALVGNIRETTDGAIGSSSSRWKVTHPRGRRSTRSANECIINTGQPTYAGAINAAYHATDEPYFFCGADDLRFYPGWLTHALAAMTDGVGVVGVNDLAYRRHSSMVRARPIFWYAGMYIARYSGVIDQPDTVLYDYDHNYTDTEFIATARMRRMYRYCSEAIVEHLHPLWGKAADDPIYAKGRRRV